MSGTDLSPSLTLVTITFHLPDASSLYPVGNPTLSSVASGEPATMTAPSHDTRLTSLSAMFPVSLFSTTIVGSWLPFVHRGQCTAPVGVCQGFSDAWGFP